MALFTCVAAGSTATHVNNNRSSKYSQDAPDYERKYRSKHVEHSRNNQLSYTVASFIIIIIIIIISLVTGLFFLVILLNQQ
jgi:hypothetical protein